MDGDTVNLSAVYKSFLIDLELWYNRQQGGTTDNKSGVDNYFRTVNDWVKRPLKGSDSLNCIGNVFIRDAE